MTIESVALTATTHGLLLIALLLAAPTGEAARPAPNYASGPHCARAAVAELTPSRRQ